MPTKTISIDVDLNMMLNRLLRARNKSFTIQVREWIIEAYKEIEHDPVMLKLADIVDVEETPDKWPSYVRVGLDHRLVVMLATLADRRKTPKGEVMRDLIEKEFSKTC